MSKMIWTEDEIRFLKQAYQKGLSLKDISRFLKRSVTAINKALSRFEIREEGGRLKNERGITCELRNQLMQEIFEISQEKMPETHPLLNFEMLAHKLVPHKMSLEEILTDVEEIFSGVLKKESVSCMKRANETFSYREEIKKKKLSYQGIEKFVHFEEVVTWLKAKGLIIEKISQDFFFFEHPGLSESLYKVSLPLLTTQNSQSFRTRTQLLILANKIRLKESLPLFYVVDITSE